MFWCFLVSLSAGSLLIGCGSSADIPSRNESLTAISLITPQIDSLDSDIMNRTRLLPGGHDLITLTRSTAVNTLLERITNRSLKDIHFDFLATRPLWKEEKSVLGIDFMNYVDIDTGMLDIDLKKFVFTDFSGNNIDAAIEVEGTGTIKASGKYTGVPATVSPQIHFYLNEQIKFAVTADSDFIRLIPVPKIVLLKTRVTVSLLGWNVPYYKEISLQIAELIKPVSIPSAVRSEIVFPIPAAQYGDRRLEFVRRYLRFTRSTVRVHNGALEYRSNIDFEKE
ncbi:MAG: hypothetical protein WCW35_07590 [Bacteroidota bacterium]